jgi:hypothetical protein
MSGEVIQPMKPPDNLIKVSPPVLNHVKQQRQVKNKMIMSINEYIINREMKLMEMGGREKSLERISATLIIQGILPEAIATSSINPYMKRHIIYR